MYSNENLILQQSHRDRWKLGDLSSSFDAFRNATSALTTHTQTHTNTYAHTIRISSTWFDPFNANNFSLAHNRRDVLACACVCNSKYSNIRIVQNHKYIMIMISGHNNFQRIPIRLHMLLVMCGWRHQHCPDSIQLFGFWCPLYISLHSPKRRSMENELVLGAILLGYRNVRLHVGRTSRFNRSEGMRSTAK